MNIRSLSMAALGLLASSSVLAQANAGPDTSLCVNSYTMRGGPLPLGATGSWALVAGCGGSMNPSDPLQLVTNLCVGVNTWMWVVDDGGMLSSDIVEITVYDPNMPVANAGIDQTIVGPQSSAQLAGSPAPNWPATCQWNWVQGNGVIVEPGDPNSMVTGLIIGDNILTWNCENGPCWTSPTVDTVVIQLMQTPTGIEDKANGQPNSFAYNPGTRELHFLNGTSLRSFEIIDSHGRCIITTNGGTRTISMNDRPEGIYVARAIVDDRAVVQRFVVGY